MVAVRPRRGRADDPITFASRSQLTSNSRLKDSAKLSHWTGLAFYCTVAAESSLRPTTLQQGQRSSLYVPLSSRDGPWVFAHRRIYPMLVGRDIEVDCRRRLGIRSFSSSLPPDLGLRTSFGR